MRIRQQTTPANLSSESSTFTAFFHPDEAAGKLKQVWYKTGSKPLKSHFGTSFIFSSSWTHIMKLFLVLA